VQGLRPRHANTVYVPDQPVYRAHYPSHAHHPPPVHLRICDGVQRPETLVAGGAQVCGAVWLGVACWTLRGVRLGGVAWRACW
jgi:hypothetical protein